MSYFHREDKIKFAEANDEIVFDDSAISERLKRSSSMIPVDLVKSAI